MVSVISTRSIRGCRCGRQSFVSIPGTPYENQTPASSVIFTDAGRSSSTQICRSAGSHGWTCSTIPSAKSLIQAKSGSSGDRGTESGHSRSVPGESRPLRIAGRLNAPSEPDTAPACPIARAERRLGLGVDATTE